jgi:dihydrodipicolinate synthase/N-acetylneuraminate lyase
MTQFHIRGVIPPLVTPYTGDSGAIDGETLQRHVDWLIGKGVHGLMPCGTTGEGPLLTSAERNQVLDLVLGAADGRVPVIAHVGAITTRETIALATYAAERGTDAVSVVTPYYFGLPDEALVAHFTAVASEVPGVPVFLYNIPQCAVNRVTPSILQEAASCCPNIIGIKDSAGDMAVLQGFLEADGGRFQVACGNDGLVLASLQEGAKASISGNANAFPEVVVGIFEAFWAGDMAMAESQQHLLDEVRGALLDGRSIAMIKRGVEMRGLHAGVVRAPLAEVGRDAVDAAVERLRTAGLLS